MSRISTTISSPAAPRRSRGWRSRICSRGADVTRPRGRRRRSARSAGSATSRRGSRPGATITTARDVLRCSPCRPCPASTPSRPSWRARSPRGSRSSGRAATSWSGSARTLTSSVQMPGWTNVWTMPIQNRVDMLATGVNTAVGVRVLGRRLDDVVRDVGGDRRRRCKRLPGAADVVADPVRGKGYVEVRVDREKAAREGLSVGRRQRRARGGARRASCRDDARRPRAPRRPRPVRSRPPAATRRRCANILVPTPRKGPDGRPRLVPLGQVADVRIVEGPATIKGENGLLRNYVRLNVRGTDVAGFVERARKRRRRRGQVARGNVTSSGPGSSSTSHAPGRPWRSCCRWCWR